LFCCIHIIKVFAFGVLTVCNFTEAVAILMELQAETVTEAAGRKLNQETTDRKRGTGVRGMGSASVQH